MTNEQLFDKLRPIIMLATGVPEVIFANQQKSGNAPQGQYASLYPRQTVRQRGQSNTFKRNTPNDKIETKVRAQIIATCSVNFFRGDAHMFAELLFECNKHPNISMMLMKAGLGWNGADAVNDLTALQSANWEQRAQVSIRVMYVTETQSEISSILSASAVFYDAKGRVLRGVEVPSSSEFFVNKTVDPEYIESYSGLYPKATT